MQAQAEVKSWAEEDVQVEWMGDQIIAEAQVPMPHANTLVLNAQEAGRTSILGPINNPP